MNKLSALLMLLCFCNAQLISSAIPINIQAAISLQIDTDHLELSKDNANIWFRLRLLSSSGHHGTPEIACVTAAPVSLPTEATPGPPTVATITTAPVALPLLATTALPTTVAPSACDAEFIRVGEHCYHFSRDKASFNDASHACHSLGAALAHPNNARDNSRLTQYIRENKNTAKGWWIGANDRHTEGQWVWVHDKSPVDYSDWLSGEPNDAYENEDCGHLRKDVNYKWNDAPCGNKYNYICQQVDLNDDNQSFPSEEETIASVTTSTVATLTVSKSDFIQLGDQRYYFSPDKATFDQALSACQSLDTQLAHPMSKEENSKLTKFLANNYEDDYKGWWIGANDRDSEGQWVWAHDKSPVGYSNWLSGEPSNSYENEHCAQLRRHEDHKWNDVPCDNKYNYICQYENVIVESEGSGESSDEVETTSGDVEMKSSTISPMRKYPPRLLWDSSHPRLMSHYDRRFT